MLLNHFLPSRVNHVTDPLIITETTPDESLEPFTLIERWESEEGSIYMSFEDFLTMATKATTKVDQVAPANKLADVNILNEMPEGAVGVLYITQGMHDKLQDLVDRMSLQVTRNLLWIGIMSSAGDDTVPSFDDVFGKYYAMATSPEAYLFVGFRSDNDGSYRTPVSQGQYDKIVQNSESILRDIADLKEFKLNGFEPICSRGNAYEQVAGERKDWLNTRASNQRNREVANGVAAKDAAANMPAPF